MFIYMSRGAKLLEFVFTGGEPLLDFDTLRHLTHYAQRATREAGMDVSFVLKTNGLLLNDEVKGFLIEHGLKTVISIDGRATLHDKYRKSVSGKKTHHVVARNLKDLLLQGASCVASFTVHPGQCLSILLDIQYLHELGANRIDIGPAYRTVAWNERHISVFLEALQDVASYMREVRRLGGRLEVGPLFSESEHVGNIYLISGGAEQDLRSSHFCPMDRSQAAVLGNVGPKIPRPHYRRC